MVKRLLTVLCVAACVLCLVSCDRYEPPVLDSEQPTALAGEDIFIVTAYKPLIGKESCCRILR